MCISNARILIADNDEGFCESLKDVFESFNYESFIAIDGQMALEILEHKAIDVSIIDSTLSGMMGFNLLKNVKSKNPDNICIMITGNTSIDHSIRAMDDGADGFFLKPIEIQEILKKIENSLERKKLQQKAKKSAMKYRLIAENANDLISILSPDLIFEYVNEEAHLKNLGYKKEELLGNCILDLLHPEDKAKLSSTFLRSNQEPKLYDEIRIKHKQDGTTRWFEVKGSVFSDDSDQDKILAIIRDITARKEVEKLLEKENARLKEIDQMRNMIVSNLAHELKTPLIPIYTTSTFILEKFRDQLTPDILNFIQVIFRGASRLKTLLEQFLEVSRMGAKKVELHLSRNNLISLIQGILDDLKVNIENNQHSIKFDYAKEIELNLDKNRMEQVLLNLIINAIKNTQPGGVITIQVNTRPNCVEVAIKDTGVGITPDEFKTLFTQFGRFDRGHLKLDISYDGTGLGLFISKEIIELHGGRMWAESRGRNKGSTFYFTIPT